MARIESDRSSEWRTRTAREIEQWLVAHIARELRCGPAAICPSEPFAALGLNSVQAIGLTGELETWIGQNLPATLVWDYPNIRALAAHLATEE